MARGRGTLAPNARHADVYRFVSSAFIGLPCPRNAAGIRFVVDVMPVMGSSTGALLDQVTVVDLGPGRWTTFLRFRSSARSQ